MPCASGAEPVEANAGALLTQADLKVSGLGRGPNRCGFTRQQCTWLAYPMRRQVSWPEGRVKGCCEGRREGVENSNWPAVMVTRRKLTRRPGRDGRAFPEDVDSRSMEVPTVRA